MTVSLVVVQGRPKGKLLSFPPGEYLVGRGEECHVRPLSPWVSRQHCLVRVTKESLLVRDLNSSNGTLVNGECLRAERCLAPGDELQVGPLVLRVVDPPRPGTPAAGEPAATASPVPVELGFTQPLPPD